MSTATGGDPHRWSELDLRRGVAMVRESQQKTRMYATRAFRKGDVAEIAQAVEMPEKDTPHLVAPAGQLQPLVFAWKAPDVLAMLFGFVAFYRRAAAGDAANVALRGQHATETVEVYCLCDVSAGAELVLQQPSSPL